jgi:hypothetical protein
MVSMGNWKKVLAKCFFAMLPSAATRMQYDVHHIFPSLACNKLIRIQSDLHQISL